MSDKLREIAEQEAQHAVGTVAWPYFKRLDAVTSAKEQDRLTGRFHTALQQARDLVLEEQHGARMQAEAEVERLRHELDDAKRSRDDAVGRYVESTSAFSRASESNRARQRGILLPRRSPAALPATAAAELPTLDTLRAEVERLRAAGATVAEGAERFRQEGLADRAEVERLKVERDEAWSAANSAEAKLAEALKNNDPASYSSMVYWREKCYEARAEVERLRAALQQISEGEGRYSRDPLEHASNTIEDMQMLALAALEGP